MYTRIAVLLVLLFGLIGWVYAEEPQKKERERVTYYRNVIEAVAAQHGGDPKKWVVKDTGESVPLSDGTPGLVVELYHKNSKVACLTAIHTILKVEMKLLCYERIPEIEM